MAKNTAAMKISKMAAYAWRQYRRRNNIIVAAAKAKKASKWWRIGNAVMKRSIGQSKSRRRKRHQSKK
jgi:hypothetical protein